MTGRRRPYGPPGGGFPYGPPELRWMEESPTPGLAGERTDLAWNRSGLALLACGIAVAKGLKFPIEEPAHAVVGVIILVLGAFTWFMGQWEARKRRRNGHDREVATMGDLAPVAYGTAAVGVAAFVLALFFPG
ncbi:MAG: DUF202 domain-containing protein [Acidimicrobiia bacterium]